MLLPVEDDVWCGPRGEGGSNEEEEEDKEEEGIPAIDTLPRRQQLTTEQYHCR